MEQELNKLVKPGYKIKVGDGWVGVYHGNSQVYATTFSRSEGIEVAKELLEPYLTP